MPGDPVVDWLPFISSGAWVVWYAEGSRQTMLSPYVERSWETLAHGIVALLVGGILATAAGRLASLVDRSSAMTS